MSADDERRRFTIWVFKQLRHLRFQNDTTRIMKTMDELSYTFEKLYEAGKLTGVAFNEMTVALERTKRLMYAHRIEDWHRRHARRRGRR